MATIDLNADLGESTAGNPVADDQAMLQLVSSANIACGFHAGDARTMSSTVKTAEQQGVAIGAHVAYNDPAGFGRRFMDYDPAELADEVLYQIGALDAFARAHGTDVRYVKPHGALYNAIVHHRAQAQAVIDGIAAFNRELAVMLLPGGVAVEVAEHAGLSVIAEAFADRGYNPDGSLVKRGTPGALLTDPEAVAERVRRIAEDGSIVAIDGSVLHVGAQSVCVHGDSPSSVQLTEAVVAALQREDVSIRSVL
ncbi:LamB/YcsF family protein [Corynebacterium tapiri]|uniref:5-oxoprolinase subunit A n=1 Tax=Corynebacterium tapiri TaxID=1448266 RepID=A0A5C4U837_9CORY|nr:5-oxoprolinase subunit PxpA [Corynebacterium tapiri]TNM00531.1 LamB/YcsF family protein [Corynebacterium tapiri]